MFFLRPLLKWFVTSPFGMRKHPITGEVKLHNGVDLRAEKGTPVYNIADGEVTGSYYHNEGGRTLIVEHGDGYSSRFGHLDEILPDKGDFIKKGEIIAKTGDSGSSITAPHLHFGIKQDGEYLNPEDLKYKRSNKTLLYIIGGSILLFFLLNEKDKDKK